MIQQQDLMCSEIFEDDQYGSVAIFGAQEADGFRVGELFEFFEFEPGKRYRVIVQDIDL